MKAGWTKAGIVAIAFAVICMSGCGNEEGSVPQLEQHVGSSTISSNEVETFSEPVSSQEMENPNIEQPLPDYAEGSPLSGKYSIQTDGFDPLFTESDGNTLEVYVINSNFLSIFHKDQSESIKIPESTSIGGRFCVVPMGIDDHPILLLIMYPKKIVDETGKLAVDEHIYSQKEMEPYLVFSDTETYIYQIQPLICGQPFSKCWEQLIQYGEEIRNSSDPDMEKWRSIPLRMEHHNQVLNAATYFVDNISNLIVPYDEMSVKETD